MLRLLHLIGGATLKIFFRRIELVNPARVPVDDPLVFVANHPNALVDPLLLFVALPRRVSFLGKSTIFKMPVIGWLARMMETLPVYRQSDAPEDMGKNRETFRACRDLLKADGAIALFPEGVSHDEPRLLPLKTGAARIALGAMSVGVNPDAVKLKIVPVGLFYTNKTTFRSEVMVSFGEPFEVPPGALGDDGEPERGAVKDLTERIETALGKVTINAESANEMETAIHAEEVFSSVYEVNDPRQSLAEKFAFMQNFAEINEETSAEAGVLEKRLTDYQKKLDELGVEPENLALPQYSRLAMAKYVLSKFWFLVLAAPLAIIGLILHFPAYKLCNLPVRAYGKDSADMSSTIKIISGLVFMSLTWGIIAFVVDYFFDWKVALVSLPLAFLCGYLAVRSVEEIEELRGWLKVGYLFLARRQKFLRLLAERQKLHRELKEFDQ